MNIKPKVQHYLHQTQDKNKEEKYEKDLCENLQE